MPDPFDPNATMAQPLAKVPPPQLPVAAGASPQVQPAPALARGIMGTTAPQGSAGASLAQAKPLATAQPTQPTQTPSEKEAARLRGSKPGVQQVHNPFLRTLATVGDALASTFAPRLATVLPGTTLHHNMLLNQAEHGGTLEQQSMDNASKRALEAAQEQNQEAIPELKRTQAELAGQKQAEVGRHNQSTEDISRAKNEGAQAGQAAARKERLAAHGFKEDESGKIVPLEYGEMSEEQQAVHDLKGSQAELADASAQLKKAQASNQPQMMALAQARLASAQQAHQIAERRLGLSEMQTEGRLFGTNQGKPLPGAMLTDENKPVGTAFQQNVRPTGMERGRADLAASAQEQLNDMRSIVQKHPEYFGPGAGRVTAFQKWIGSQDPEAQKFLTASEILASHATGVFGARSAAEIAAQKIASGELKDNPAAIVAALSQVDKAMKTIQSRGVVKTVGSNASKEEQNPQLQGGGKEAQGGYKIGTKYGNLEYLGGDPKDRGSWK